MDRTHGPSKQRRLPRPATTPSGSAFAGIRDQLLAQPHVVGCGVGPPRRAGRLLRAPAICVLVKRKRSPEKVRPKASLIPEALEWELRPAGRKRQLRTDVQELDPRRSRLLGSPEFWGPGDRVVHPGYATVGVAIQHPQLGPVVTTAGHAVPWEQSGERSWPAGANHVSLSQQSRNAPRQADVRRALMTDVADYALLTPPELPAGNLYRDRYPIGAPYLPDHRIFGQPVWMLGQAAPQETRVTLLSASVPLGAFGWMHDTLLTLATTDPGDSGSVLVDNAWRAIGLLVGEVYLNGIYSAVWMPPTVLLHKEGATWL